MDNGEGKMDNGHLTMDNGRWIMDNEQQKINNRKDTLDNLENIQQTIDNRQQKKTIENIQLSVDIKRKVISHCVGQWTLDNTDASSISFAHACFREDHQLQT